MAAEEQILSLARDRFKIASEAEDEMRRLAEEDLEFKIGNQWPKEEAKQREEDHRPMLRINRLQQHIKQVVNQQRMNRPGIQVDAVSDDAEDDIADILEGMVRNIENISNAEFAYDQGYEQAVDAGFGHWRVTTEYSDNDGFDQDIFIRPMKNRFSVLFDPDTELACKEDARWCFVYDKITREEFRSRYPKADMSGMGETPTGNEYEGWWGKDYIKYAEYFYKEKIDKLMVLFEVPGGGTQALKFDGTFDGERISEKDWIGAHEELGFKALRDRTIEETQVRWCRHTGTQIIEKSDWAGMYIPIVRVVGDSTYLAGREYISGLVRWAKDPVMAYNYWVTAATEQLALQPKAPFIIADEQLAEYKNWWSQANRKNFAFLPYKHTNGIPRPERVAPPQTPTGLMNMLAVASDDIKATTGIYDASLGARGNETSGIAIAERQEQGDISSFHYVDNLNRAIAFTGRIIVDLIPKIYDTERAVRILGADGQAQLVKVNALIDGERRIDLSKGRYDVHIEAGPTYATKRKETAATILEALKAVPQYAPILAPMLFKNVDAAGAEEVAQAMESMSPVQQGMPGEMPEQM